MSRATLILAIGLLMTRPVVAQSRGDADALYADSQWREAAAAYQAVVSQSPADGAAWFGLAQSNHQLTQWRAAESAYLKALESGFQPPLRVHYHLARLYMSDGQRDKALEQLETLAGLGGLTPRMLLAVAELEPLADDPRFIAVLEQLKPCNTQHYRQFDFWLGEWDVTGANAPAASARNSITSVQDGCAVFEQYQTNGGFAGMSLNFYDSVTERWHQTWMGNGGGAVYLEGGIENGAMVMSDADLAVSEISGTVNRVTWSPLEDGRVRQHWQQSQDEGETWATVFDGYYSRADRQESQ